jgi:hypothetical protein
MTSTATFLRLLRAHLCSATTEPQQRLCMVRVARVRPITGSPITGWRA